MLRSICVLFVMAVPTVVAAQAPSSLSRAQFIANMDGEFRKMDADKNGQLSAREIEQFQKLQAVAQAEARARAAFARLDSDRNGVLSQAEFGKAMTPSAASNSQPMLARMDGNKDKQVNLIEHRTATLARFDRIDADKDGTVTPAEMKAGGLAAR